MSNNLIDDSRDMVPGLNRGSRTQVRKATLSVLLALSIGILSATPLLAEDQDAGRIYGTIYTVDGETLEGYIRWDKNEAFWGDVLDGSKRRPRLEDNSGRKKYRDRKITFFGWEFNISSKRSQSGICFGHIARLEPSGKNSAILLLKSEEEIEFKGGSTDIGRDIREIVIEDSREGELELEWEDIDWIEFSESPGEGARGADGAVVSASVFGSRLYGTVTTRKGDDFTGYVVWDMDESFTRDVMDGYERDRKRKIRFGKIESIERRGSDGVLVTTTDGKRRRLEDSNDVDSRNRGIVVTDVNLGRVVIEWEDFGEVKFSPAPSSPTYDTFDGGKRLRGTVYTDDDESYKGEITWDKDEQFTWEILDGEYRNIQLDIFFSNIKSIEKSRRGALVTLLDGREFRLRDSNDIDDDNKGIYIRTADGELEEVEWDYFDKVVFDH